MQNMQIHKYVTVKSCLYAQNYGDTYEQNVNFGEEYLGASIDSPGRPQYN